MHIGYALIVVASLLRQVDACLSAIGAVYPPFVLLVIVATGNQFFLDAAAGALVAVLAAALAAVLTRRPATAQLAAVQSAGTAPERIAARTRTVPAHTWATTSLATTALWCSGADERPSSIFAAPDPASSVTGSTTCPHSTRATSARSPSGSIP
jgi:hypothetical protein